MTLNRRLQATAVRIPDRTTPVADVVGPPAGERFLDGAGIELQAWLFVIPFAIGMLMLEECRKYLARHFMTIKPLAAAVTQRNGT
jgi:hypothetical protein